MQLQSLPTLSREGLGETAPAFSPVMKNVPSAPWWRATELRALGKEEIYVPTGLRSTAWNKTYLDVENVVAP